MRPGSRGMRRYAVLVQRFDDAWQAAAASLDARCDRKIALLCGAGLSTDSGIPDYRGAKTRRLARAPMRIDTFRSDAGARQRYWARAMVGWLRIDAAQPNAGHLAIAQLDDAKLIAGTITQNVDGLQPTRGASDLVQLHGALREVGCLNCAFTCERETVQARLESLNPGLLARMVASVHARGGSINPDGDAELDEQLVAQLQVAACPDCEGPLKPRVVYFGEQVPRPVVDRAYAIVDAAHSLLVLGSSLAVFSGYRFVRRAHARGLAIVIVNRGETRGDPLATHKLQAGLSEFLPWLSGALTAASPASNVACRHSRA